MSDLETKVERSLETLHNALSNLEPAIEHVQNAIQVTKAAKNVVDQNVLFLEDQKLLNIEYKTQLLNSLNKEVDKITLKSNDVLNSIDLSTKDIVSLDKSLNNYLQTIKKIDFPTRLTSIEGDISSTSSAFNNMQGTVNNIQNEIIRLERENKANTEVLKTDLQKDYEVIVQKIELVNKENKTLKIIMICTAIIALAAVITNLI